MACLRRIYHTQLIHTCSTHVRLALYMCALTGVPQARLPVTFPNVENEQKMTMEQYPGTKHAELGAQSCVNIFKKDGRMNFGQSACLKTHQRHR